MGGRWGPKSASLGPEGRDEPSCNLARLSPHLPQTVHGQSSRSVLTGLLPSPPPPAPDMSACPLPAVCLVPRTVPASQVALTECLWTREQTGNLAQ